MPLALVADSPTQSIICCDWRSDSIRPVFELDYPIHMFLRPERQRGRDALPTCVGGTVSELDARARSRSTQSNMPWHTLGTAE